MEYHISGKIQRVLCGYFRKKTELDAERGS
ncbi:hypothetical protein PF004_g2577 [Phytophthora fragariae]|uniref:Uncharacterized protein n=1 Tax=Phytophthora fragariae TaxID=53985 RepID=A0A6G0PP33_9STRA|nr:hypothetical protein PF004_g2577 [Phytophthora fragariae]